MTEYNNKQIIEDKLESLIADVESILEVHETIRAGDDQYYDPKKQ